MIIGLTGKKQSGKTTAADYFVLIHGCREESFAAPLKQMAQILLGTDAGYFGSDEVKKISVIPEWGVTGRQLLQIMGTELFRNELPKHLPQLQGVWVKRLQRILSSIGPNETVVVPDVRFPDEAEMIRKLGGKIVKIVAKSNAASSTDDHESENQVIEYDHIITNNKDTEFFVQLDCLINSFELD